MLLSGGAALNANDDFDGCIDFSSSLADYYFAPVLNCLARTRTNSP